MGRMIGWVLLVCAVWGAVEVYTKGLDEAFGGVLASSSASPRAPSTPDRARDAFQRAYSESEQRVLRQLDPESPPE